MQSIQIFVIIILLLVDNIIDKGNIGNNKFILQWGTCSSSDGDTNGVTQTLPTSFSNTNYKVVVTSKAIGAVSVGSVSITSSSKFVFCAREGTKGSSTYYSGTSFYIAIGY